MNYLLERDSKVEREWVRTGEGETEREKEREKKKKERECVREVHQNTFIMASHLRDSFSDRLHFNIMFTVTQLNAGLYHDINLRPSCIEYLMGWVVNELKHFGGKTCFENVHIFRGWDGETKNDFKTCVPQV